MFTLAVFVLLSRSGHRLLPAGWSGILAKSSFALPASHTVFFVNTTRRFAQAAAMRRLWFQGG